MSLTAAVTIPSYTHPNGAAVRKCIEYGIAQSGSQEHVYYMSRLGWPAHVVNKIMKKNVYIPDQVQRSNAVVYRVVLTPSAGNTHFMGSSMRAGIGQWHEYDCVACNKLIYVCEKSSNCAVD